MVQQQVDDVGVSLLRRLVKGRVAALHKTQPWSAAVLCPINTPEHHKGLLTAVTLVLALTLA